MSDIAHSERDKDRRAEVAGEWLLLLRENEVPEETVSRWIEWCHSDERNLRAFEELQSLWQAAARHPPDAQQLALLLRSDDRGVRRRRSARQRMLSTRGWIGMAASAAALCLVALLLVGKFGAPLENRGVRRAGPTDSVTTPLATNQETVLPDGSQVDLGARSAIDVAYTGTQRRLELRSGQAFFRVKHDATHPFVVQAGNIRVTAVGTAFDVRNSGTQVAVTVQEGTVEVTDAGNHGTPAQATAGYQLVIDTSTGASRRSIVDPQMATAWRSGRLEFAGDSLDVVIASVNRYSARQIVLGDPSLGKLTFTGTVFVDSIDASLDGMQQVFPLDVHRSSREVILVKRAN
jgi:transmembrane sensor